MNIEQFISDFIEELDDDSITDLNSSVEFRGLDAWDSLTALSIMAMLDSKYKINLTGEEMQSVHTVQELYSLVEGKNN